MAAGIEDCHIDMESFQSLEADVRMKDCVGIWAAPLWQQFVPLVIVLVVRNVREHACRRLGRPHGTVGQQPDDGLNPVGVGHHVAPQTGRTV